MNPVAAAVARSNTGGSGSRDPAAFGSGPRSWWGFAAFLVVFTFLYFFFGTHLIHQTNQDRLNWDQQHNITMAFRSLEREQAPMESGETITDSLWRSFPHYTDGVVNPLWPWVAARFADEDHEAFFVKGKWFNLILSAAFLLVLGLICARAFSIPTAISVMATAGFAALLPRSTYFQPETLYYIFFFLAWVCTLSLLRRNSLWMYGVLGFLLGLAYLAKTSVQAFLLVFFGVTLLRCLVEWGRSGKRDREDGAILALADDRWNVANHFIGLAVLVMTFLAAAGPRLSYANEAFGDPFHAFPSYWMWMDDFSEGVAFMQKYGSAEALAGLEGEEKPSATTYLKTHSQEETLERLQAGTTKKLREFWSPPEWRKSGRELLPFRGWLLAGFYAMFAVMAVMRSWARRQKDRWVWPVDSQSARWMLLFAFGVFAVSALAFGFYEPIGKGDRFLLSLYLPMVLTPLWLGERFRRQLQRTTMGKWATGLFFGMHGLIMIAVIVRVLNLLADPVFQRGMA